MPRQHHVLMLFWDVKTQFRNFRTSKSRNVILMKLGENIRNES